MTDEIPANSRTELEAEALETYVAYVAMRERIQAGELVLLPSIGGGYLMGCVGFIAEPALVDAMAADQVALDLQDAEGPL